MRSKPSTILPSAVAVICAVLALTPALTRADVSGAASSKTAAARVAAGARFTCAITGAGDVRCWGIGIYGALGQGNTGNIGDDETPASVPPIDLGPGVRAQAISAGFYHACATDQNDELHCWGENREGQLGYGGTESIGDDEIPAAAGTGDFGDHTVKAFSAGGFHTCAILDDDSLRCWGEGSDGRLGYGNTSQVSDPSKVGAVDLGAGRTAKAVAAGGGHTCVILDNGRVRCWGKASNGQLGHATKNEIGDNETPAQSPYVDLGKHRRAVAISAGYLHTCALLDNGSVRCWGRGVSGQLGYGSKKNIGDDEKVSSVATVRLGHNQKAVAISAYGQHTCALLGRGGKVLCWGTGKYGQLGYGNTKSIGDNESPGSAGTVNLGRRAVAIQAGGRHSCAVLSDGKMRCWGLNSDGQLGYSNRKNIGDNEAPAVAGNVKLGEEIETR